MFLMGLLLIPRVVQGDIVWPALYVEERLWSIPPIAAGLLVELLVLVVVFQLPIKRAALVGVVMNTGSMLVGTILIPLAGLGWEVFPGLLLYHAFGIGTFNPYTWSATFLMAALITSAIESAIILFFKISIGRRRFLWLYAANCVSVGIAFLSLLVRPPRT